MCSDRDDQVAHNLAVSSSLNAYSMSILGSTHQEIHEKQQVKDEGNSLLFIPLDWSEVVAHHSHEERKKEDMNEEGKGEGQELISVPQSSSSSSSSSSSFSSFSSTWLRADLVVLSDVFYEEESTLTLVHFLDYLVSKKREIRQEEEEEETGQEEETHPSLSILAVSPTNRRGYTVFLEAMAEHGFIEKEKFRAPTEWTAENPLEGDAGDITFQTLFFRFQTDVLMCLHFEK